MSTSVAAKEAFFCLNAGMKKEFRGWGDTRTAARDRAAKEAGVTPAQGTRLWKNWQTMASVDGDVYRLLFLKYGHLLPKYGHLCSWIENAADAIERETQEIEEANAVFQGHSPVGEGVARKAQGEERAA